jgi:hypothetical protein
MHSQISTKYKMGHFMTKICPKKTPNGSNLPDYSNTPHNPSKKHSLSCSTFFHVRFIFTMSWSQSEFKGNEHSKTVNNKIELNEKSLLCPDLETFPVYWKACGLPYYALEMLPNFSTFSQIISFRHVRDTISGSNVCNLLHNSNDKWMKVS